jgi:3-dehydroquinate synthetase
VWIDPEWLHTLPEREWRSGFGELIKTGLLAGEPLWSQTAQAAPGWVDPAPVMALVEAAARHKLRVVRQDPREQGIRATLNLGHTLGHAVENYTAGAGWSHGEAVGVGLLGALWLSERAEGLSSAVADAVRGALSRWGMPMRVPPAPASQYWARMGRDKKRRHDGLRWVLLRAVGEPVVRPVSPELVAEMLSRLGAEPD